MRKPLRSSRTRWRGAWCPPSSTGATSSTAGRRARPARCRAWWTTTTQQTTKRSKVAEPVTRRKRQTLRLQQPEPVTATGLHLGRRGRLAPSPAAAVAAAVAAAAPPRRPRAAGALIRCRSSAGLARRARRRPALAPPDGLPRPAQLEAARSASAAGCECGGRGSGHPRPRSPTRAGPSGEGLAGLLGWACLAGWSRRHSQPDEVFETVESVPRFGPSCCCRRCPCCRTELRLCSGLPLKPRACLSRGPARRHYALARCARNSERSMASSATQSRLPAGLMSRPALGVPASSP
mmetsp:Transcript_14438/g.54623  ORF Transcript_14438/g.54623 Transcript_14438/m.54623 type:complete len:293 (-) Transcript_14438:260-1138(-)